MRRSAAASAPRGRVRPQRDPRCGPRHPVTDPPGARALGAIDVVARRGERERQGRDELLELADAGGVLAAAGPCRALERVALGAHLALELVDLRGAGRGIADRGRPQRAAPAAAARGAPLRGPLEPRISRRAASSSSGCARARRPAARRRRAPPPSRRRPRRRDAARAPRSARAAGPAHPRPAPASCRARARRARPAIRSRRPPGAAPPRAHVAFLRLGELGLGLGAASDRPLALELGGGMPRLAVAHLRAQARHRVERELLGGAHPLPGARRAGTRARRAAPGPPRDVVRRRGRDPEPRRSDGPHPWAVARLTGSSWTECDVSCAGG